MHQPGNPILNRAIQWRDELHAQVRAQFESQAAPIGATAATGKLEPANAQDRTKNPLRPQRLAEIVGQDEAKRFISAAIGRAKASGRPMDHVLFVAGPGTGKSTFAHVIANELGVDCYDLEAPISYDTLVELRAIMRDGDILKIEEIHQQAWGDRRQRNAALAPEVLYSVMEDRVMLTQDGPVPFPAITVMGTTTDEGQLPDAFINRFPIRPYLEPYTREQLREIVIANRRVLGLRMTHGAVEILADASRGTPRQINNLVKNAVILTAPGGLCDRDIAREVLRANGLTHDGLTRDMQGMLLYLYLHGRTPMARTGEVRYQAGLPSIATHIGKGRDSKAIQLRVEPYLIQRGFVQVVAGAGRRLTDAGIQRARELAA